MTFYMVGYVMRTADFENEGPSFYYANYENAKAAYDYYRNLALEAAGKLDTDRFTDEYGDDGLKDRDLAPCRVQFREISTED
jgi:hypothetical protein